MTDLYGPIQSRIETAANWASSNPTLLLGEIGIARIATGRIGVKVGDGATAWNSLGYAAGTFGAAGLGITQPYANPAAIIAAFTAGDGVIRVPTSANRTNGLLTGYAGTDGGDAIAEISSASSLHGAVGGYCYARQSGQAYVYHRGPGLTLGGAFAEGTGSTVRLHGNYGWAGGYVAHWNDTAGSTTTEIFAQSNGVAFGYAAYGGRIYAAQGVALGTAYGPGAQLEANTGSVFGFAYIGSDTSLTGMSVKLKASGQGSAVFGYAKASASSRNARIYATERGGMAGGFAQADASFDALINASGKAALAFGYCYASGAAASIVASGKGSVQFGPGTNAVDNSLAVGAALRLNGPVGTPGALRNGDVWVGVGGHLYARGNGATVQLT